MYREKQERNALPQCRAQYPPYLLSDNIIRDYQELRSVYAQFSPLLAQAIEKRTDVYHQLKSGQASFSSKTYQLNDQVIQLLGNKHILQDEFKQCDGNQLQHTIHRESIAILEQVAVLPTYSVVHSHEDSLVDCVVALSLYNKEGLVDKASTIADFCWTLLDYGQAIAEGAALGLYTTGQDLITNPIEATICIVAGKQVLAYQLCKVLYNVADIGATAISDYDRAQEKWNDYTAPITHLIAAIKKKKSPCEIQ